MKLKVQPENLGEWIALKANLAPMPLVDTQVAFNAARAIMAAADLGVYEALGKNSLTSAEVAQKCNTHPEATKHLLDCLVGTGYLKWDNKKYSLKPKFYKWLLKESDSNLIGKLRFQLFEWNYMSNLENYTRTGKPMDLHETISSQEWESYQEGMRDLSVNAAKELAKKMPLPAGATKMLDIGGSHGLFSIELCKKHPNLASTILDLPSAIPAASAIAKRYDTTGGRVKYVGGNVLTDDLGENHYDLVMINNVVHHFTEEQNRMLAAKIARALKTNGIYAIGEFIRTEKPGEGGLVAATLSLYFSMTSYSGTWSAKEMESWQTSAALKPQKTVTLMSMPGLKMIVAKKA